MQRVSAVQVRGRFTLVENPHTELSASSLVFLTLAWGIGIVMNAWEVYFRRPITEADVRREIERMTGRS